MKNGFKFYQKNLLISWKHLPLKLKLLSQRRKAYSQELLMPKSKENKHHLLDLEMDYLFMEEEEFGTEPQLMG